MRARVLVWGRDPVVLDLLRHVPMLRSVQIVESTAAPADRPATELVIADVDTLSEGWGKELSRLRRLNPDVPIILLSADWPKFARMHAWRPCGYVRKPFHVDELLRVEGDLARDVQAAHRPNGNPAKCSPGFHTYGECNCPALPGALRDHP